MTVTIHLVVLFVLAVLTGSSQTRGQSSVAPPVFITQSAFQSHANTSASPDLTEDPGNEVPKRTRDPASRDETMTITGTKGSVDPENVTNAVFETGLLSMSSAAAATPPHADMAVVASAHTGAASSPAAAHGLSSTPPPWGTTPLHRISPAESRAPLTGDPPTAVSTQPAHTVQGTSSTARSSTAQPQSESLTIDRPLTSALGPAGPRHREVPSELNIGDEDLKVPRHRPSSPLDPLLAGLLSVFIVTTAIIFVGLFLKLRQRTNHPEFHRLQDLPMDDLMEDTPLSRYTY